MISDNWTYILFNALTSQNLFLFGIVMTALYFCCMFVFENNILIDLAVAVILENFELSDEDKRYGQVVQMIDRLEQKNIKANANYFRYAI